MLSRLTRIVIPVIGLLAVTAALAFVGTAPLVLFPSSKETGPQPAPPSASTEVASVTAPPLGRGGPGSAPGTQAPGASTPGGASADGGAAGGSPVAGAPDKSGGIVDRPPTGPGTQVPDDGGQEPGQGNGKKDKDKDKDKEHKGKAKGHSKDKAQGEAKGHDKWQGRDD